VVMTVQELEEFFKNNPIPKNTQLNPAMLIVDPDRFIEVNMGVIRVWKQDLEKCPSYWHLCELIRVMSGSDDTPATQENIRSTTEQ